MGGASTAFIFAAIAIRTLSAEFNAFEINAVRSAGGLILLVFAGISEPSLFRDLKLSSAPFHIPRNIVHALGGLLWTIAIATLPLATVFSLEFTAPAWAALLAYPILGEKPRLRTVVGIAASFAGVLMIWRPEIGSLNTAALVPLGAAFFFGISVLLTRKLTRFQTIYAILFWMMVIQLPINLAGAYFFPSSGYLFRIGLAEAAALGALAVAGLCSQLCLSRALQIGEASVVMTLDFLRVPLIAVVGVALYSEALDIWVLAGFAAIAAGIAFGTLTKRSPVHDPLAGS
jgi:drug/metabolite transporter (DMT)-like permease